MPPNNLISVIIPTHNRQQDLKKAIASVFCQTVLPCEVIVVDDGSKPKVTRDIFANAPEGMRTTLLRNEEPKGAPHARNRGIEAAQGPWIAFLDDDDQFKPNKIEVVARHIQENPESDLIYHPAEIHMVKEGVTYTTTPRHFSPKDDIFRRLLVKNEIGGTPMVVARKTVLQNAGMFEESLPALQDYELWLRIARITKNFSFIPIPLTQCHYITKKSSISKSIEANQKAVNFIERKYIKKYSILTNTEKNELEQRKSNIIVHKLLLSGNIFPALKQQLKHTILNPTPYNTISLFVILAGPRIAYTIKAKLNSLNNMKHKTTLPFMK